ncbi:alanine racemase [Altererythrobacter lutimaris]|uniref:Alanine racemase n=1 Tax=Altererythrobacter lutimaris TaxID=2743979 RepID=A0A850H4B7_9SPHN|nr:alanine racemase [Altererythrobacter lutimaris]NVE94034.1 alanine racemase [Altererythrobacter lutimaris]
MPDKPSSTLRLTVDTDALAANWRALDAMSGAAKAGAAVKADCYGLGVDTCVPVLRDAGCQHFFVAHWSEVEAVAHHIPASQIAVLHGVLTSEDADYAQQIGAVPVINSVEQAERWQASGGGRCHLMVDSGINRLGLSPSELGDANVQALEVDVLMSHLACADEDSPMNARQLEVFKQTRQQVAHRSASLANSAGIALGSDYHFNLTRPGLALYGGVPRTELSGAITPVAGVEAAILQTRTICAGETVGYNARFTADRDMRIGVVSLGYADGILRSWRGQGAFTFGDKHLPMLGTVSMDMIVADLTEAPEVREGNWVTLPYNLQNAAQQSGLSQYELLTVLGTRLRSGNA